MNYGKLSYCDTTNGIGCRTVLFVSGCRHHCRQCFNQETWNFSYGKPYTDLVKQRILDSLAPSYIDGLTILGGEPMEPENQPFILDLLQSVKSLHPQKTIWIYSGYRYEELMGTEQPVKPSLINPETQKAYCHTPYVQSILSHLDMLVDGEFQQTQKSMMLAFRGSKNQRIIDVQASLQQNTIILSDYMNMDR